MSTFDMSSHFAHFWSQFLSDFHVWPLKLKLRTFSTRWAHVHINNMGLKGLKMAETVPKIADISNFGKQWIVPHTTMQVHYHQMALPINPLTTTSLVPRFLLMNRAYSNVVQLFLIHCKPRIDWIARKQISWTSLWGYRGNNFKLWGCINELEKWNDSLVLSSSLFNSD